jgi:hypothetical protein
MNGRYFAERRIQAYLFDGKEKFFKSRSNMEEDAERLEKFSKWIEEQ